MRVDRNEVMHAGDEGLAESWSVPVDGNAVGMSRDGSRWAVDDGPQGLGIRQKAVWDSQLGFGGLGNKRDQRVACAVVNQPRKNLVED